MAERESPYLWSTTALTNGTIDPSIQWPEGMPPSGVNNAARSKMAADARFLKDTNGSLTSGGSANAYTLTANTTKTAYATGLVLSFKANHTNTGASTLNVTNADATAIGAKAIRVSVADGDVALSANMICSGGLYDLKYDAAANAAAGAFILINPTWASGITLTPAASSTNRAIVSTQTGPTTSTAGPLSYNLLSVTQQGPTTGSGYDAFGLFNKQSVSYRFNTTIAGSTLDGTISGALFATKDLTDTTASPPEKIGLNATIYSTTTNGGNQYAAVAYNIVDGAGVKVEQVGAEIDVAIASTATVTNRHGLRIVNVNVPSGANNGSAGTLDSAITLANLGTVGGAFKSLILFQQTGFANIPLKTTASFFLSDSAMTVANIFSLANVTVTGKIMDFPAFFIQGNGTIDAGAGVSIDGPQRITLRNASTGTSALTTFQPENNTGTLGNIGCAGTNYTDHPLMANRVSVQANTASDGIAIVASAADPIIFGISDVESGRFTTTRGKFTLGVAGAAAGQIELAGSTSNSLTIKAAAAAGSGSTITLPAGTTDFSATGGTSNVVKQASAGAAFTVGQLAASDLSNGTTGSGAVVLAGTPTLTTPVLGAATATTINGAALDNNAWSTYTPTISSQSGTITTSSAAGRYKQIGKTVHLAVDITITNAGSGTGYLTATLPVTAQGLRNVGSSVEYSATGRAGSATLLSTTVLLTKEAAGTSYIVTGQAVAVSITYEAA